MKGRKGPSEAERMAERSRHFAEYWASFPTPRFKAGDRITGPFTGPGTVLHANKGATPRSACTYSVRTDRGILESVNEDQPLVLVAPDLSATQ